MVYDKWLEYMRFVIFLVILFYFKVNKIWVKIWVLFYN